MIDGRGGFLNGETRHFGVGESLGKAKTGLQNIDDGDFSLSYGARPSPPATAPRRPLPARDGVRAEPRAAILLSLKRLMIHPLTFPVIWAGLKWYNIKHG